MKKFAFPLRSIATVRNIRELQARDAFSRRVNEFVSAEQHTEEMRRRLVDLESLLSSGRLEKFRAADQATFMAAYRDEMRLVADAEKKLGEARQAMENAREAWMAARRDVRIIENLEAKARRAHAREVERETQAAMDDRACAAAARGATVES